MKHTSLKFKVMTSILSLVLFIFMSCNNTAPTNTSENNERLSPIASVNLGAEGTLEFFETEPGCLTAAGQFSSIETMAPYQDMNFIELFESMSGNTAPAALKEAYQRALSAADVSSEDAPPSSASLPDDGDNKLAKTTMTASAFISAYCSDLTDYDFSTCMTSRTGNHSYTRNCSYIRNYINPYRGTVRFQAQYWNGSSYVTAYDVVIPEDYVWYYAVAGAQKYRRMQVIEAADDGLHYTHKGNY